jgi:hypothetical protein
MLAALLIAGAVILCVGWFLGMWTRRYIWPACPEPLPDRVGTCGRPLRCPVHDASEIRSDQVAAGPRPDRLAL